MSSWLSYTLVLLVCGIAACPYHPTRFLTPRYNNPTCPEPIDDLTQTLFTPWSYAPSCLRPLAKDNTLDKDTGRATYCLYSSSTFHSNHGLSIITTPDSASNLLSYAPLANQPVEDTLRTNTYKIVEVPGKGKGMVATRKIKKGEIFLVDHPSVLIGVPFLQDVQAHHRRRLVKKGIERLSKERREAVYALARKGGNYLLDDIFAVNAVSVPLGEEEGDQAMGLFVEFSRINHDCRPNALYRFSPRTLALEVFSLRTILPGEEITVSYAPITLTRSQRQDYILQNFQFKCTCSLCLAEDSSESDHLRQRVGELKSTLRQATENEYFENALVIAHEWLEMAEKEGIPPPMPEWYDVVARLSYDVGDLAGARRYAQLALDGWTKFGSSDDSELEAARGFLRDVMRLPRDAKLERKGVPNIF